MASDLQELSRTYNPARDFDPIRTVRLVLAKTERTFTHAKVRHDQLAAAPRISLPMAPMGAFQVAEVAAAARELPNVSTAT